jgi:phosphoglycerate kinase
MIPGIRELLASYRDKIKFPRDLAVEVDSKRKEISIKTLPTPFPILDVGTKTIEDYSKVIANAQCVVVSGPVGVYENDEFSKGTELIFQEVARSNSFSLIGGGHTISAIKKFGLEKDISYISTAGGALIEFLMGKKLPGVSALEESAKKKRTYRT